MKNDAEWVYYTNQQNLQSICYRKKKTKAMVVNSRTWLLTTGCELLKKLKNSD